MGKLEENWGKLEGNWGKNVEDMILGEKQKKSEGKDCASTENIGGNIGIEHSTWRGAVGSPSLCR